MGILDHHCYLSHFLGAQQLPHDIRTYCQSCHVTSMLLLSIFLWSLLYVHKNGTFLSCSMPCSPFVAISVIGARHVWSRMLGACPQSRYSSSQNVKRWGECQITCIFYFYLCPSRMETLDMDGKKFTGMVFSRIFCVNGLWKLWFLDVIFLLQFPFYGIEQICPFFNGNSNRDFPCCFPKIQFMWQHQICYLRLLAAIELSAWCEICQYTIIVPEHCDKCQLVPWNQKIIYTTRWD